MKDKKMKNWVRLYIAAVAAMVFGFVFAGKAFAVEAPHVSDAAPVAASEHAITLTLKDHKFDKTEVEAPANQKILITVVNNDPTPEEFESKDMHREKVVAGNSTIVVSVGPLKPGVYKFVGEHHEDVAKGTLTVK
jgi:hypothetical protein